MTKEQYHFLKTFIKAGKEEKNKSDSLNYFNREKVAVEALTKLLEKSPLLNRSEPFKEANKEKEISITDYIHNYLVCTGLDRYIVHNPPKYYSLTQVGEEAIHSYKIEIFSKIKIPLISIVISLLALCISFASLLLSLS